MSDRYWEGHKDGVLDERERQRKARCEHEMQMAHYFPAVNEDGWKCCCGCDTKLGYRPDLDNSLLDIKIGGLLNDLHERQFVYVSNGTMGDGITAQVQDRCRKLDRFDQYTILREILAQFDAHAEFWQRKVIEEPPS